MSHRLVGVRAVESDGGEVEQVLGAGDVARQRRCDSSSADIVSSTNGHPIRSRPVCFEKKSARRPNSSFVKLLASRRHFLEYAVRASPMASATWVAVSLHATLIDSTRRATT